MTRRETPFPKKSSYRQAIRHPTPTAPYGIPTARVNSCLLRR